MHRRSTLVSAAAALALTGGAVAAVPGAAGAAGVTPRATLATGLVSPLTAAVAGNGTAYVTQNFAGMLMKVKGGKARPVYRAKAEGTEVGGVSLAKGRLTFTTTSPKGVGKVMRRSRSGKVSMLANTWKFEKRANPDAGTTYGFRVIGDDCASQFPADFPASYPGIQETHPYGTATKGKRTYVADAAGNSILEIDPNGHVDTVAVLPAVGVEVTAEAAEANDLPACTAGLTYWFESVPTDVEVSKDGDLLVSTLTGGPEDGSLGQQSKVYRVAIRSGHVTEVAGGLGGAVGLDEAGNGDIYVSELYAGQVSRIPAGGDAAEPWKSLPMPAAVERRSGKLFVTTNVLSDPPAGKLQRFGL